VKLIYVMDPMCSWCWAFSTQLQKFQALHPELPLEIIMGGLAPDSEMPMPAEMQQKLQQIWRHIEQQTQTSFNHDFWRANSPRRSTYPACRAVLTALLLGGVEAQQAMISAIQQAYYLQALNPSDTEVLVGLAEQIGLSSGEFSVALNSNEVAGRLSTDLAKVAELGVGGFPALLLERGDQLSPLALGYTGADKLEQRFVALAG